MISRARSCLTGLLPGVALIAVAALVAAPAWAQFKVIGPDGKVTYTDREPSPSEGKVIALGARAGSSPAESDLPYELRQVVTKYPVTLYVATNACEPCVSARQLLKQRGIPFNERMVVTSEDSDALERLSGAREAPTLTIGTQTLRGLSADVWNSYLDAAGYPRDSHLPPNYQYPLATPIVERSQAATTARADPRADPRPAAPATPPPATPGGIKF